MAQNRIPPALLHELRDAIVDSCAALYWHDGKAPPPKTVRGGCSFVLRFPERLVGVTADHVVRAFRAEKAVTPTLVSQLWNEGFDLLSAIIDCDQSLDIATFAVSESLISRMGLHTFDCRSSWPPPNPQRGQLLTIAGYPEFGRKANLDMSADFETYVGFAAVDDFSDRDIITTYDPSRDRDLSGGRGLPPLGLNLSGCSGGPAVMHGTINGIHRWVPVGLIVGGPRHDPSLVAPEFDMITMRRIRFVNPDGTLNRPDVGWLPEQPRG